MKTWSPDTCGCKVEEIYDGTRIVGGGQVLKKCPDHVDVPDDELYGVLYSNPDGENKRKNQLYAMLVGSDSTVEDFGLTETKLDAGGEERVDFKPGVKFDWSFTGEGKDRVLNVDVKGATLTAQQKASLGSKCSARYGNGKVVIK